MTTPRAGQICPSCSTNNLLSARRCEVCGAALPGPSHDRVSLNPPVDELKLAVVPLEERESVRDFESEAEAELAAGYLRSNGIPAEVGKQMIPGLAFEVAVWVRKADLEKARELMSEADRRGRGPREVE